MRINWVLLLIPLLLPVERLISLERFYEPRSIGEHFRPIGIDHKLNEPHMNVSVGYVFLTQTVGLLPDKGSLSLGLRLTARANIYKTCIFGVSYTQWDNVHTLKFHDRENDANKMPSVIFHKPLEIQTTNHLNNTEFQFGLKGKSFTPFVGCEWCLEDTIITINKESSVANVRNSLGMQAGLKNETPISKYLSFCSGFTLSCLHTTYQRSLNKSTQYTEQFFHPRSKLMLGLLLSYPKKSKGDVSIFGGYEIQYRWEKGINQRVSWRDPFALQGFTINMSITY